MRRLTAREKSAYDVLDPVLADGVRIIEVPFLAPGAAGMTIGRLVFVRHDGDLSGARPLLVHELVHVRQFAEQGRTRFLIRYLRDYLVNLVRLRNHKAAYRAIPAEVEARAETVAWRRRHDDAPPATAT
ncbi:MAG: hypothetical protein ACE5GB_02735 [Acidimicrobiales bacterium]